MKLTKQQQRSLLNLYLRGNEGTPSYLAFRRRVLFCGDYIGIKWCGMFIGIEKDGYAHS